MTAPPLVEDDERAAAFDAVLRSAPWQLLVRDVIVPAAVRARTILFSGVSSYEEVRAAQATLLAYRLLIEKAYAEAAWKLPEDVRLLLSA